jgi:hypothetical protein
MTGIAVFESHARRQERRDKELGSTPETLSIYNHDDIHF